MVQPRRPGTARAVFDDAYWRADTIPATPEARRAAEKARDRYKADGVLIGDLKPTLAEGPDGTRLPGCVKVYIDEWGMVFQIARDRDTGQLVLAYLAFGERHPTGNRPSVYQTADRRLNPRR
jgi:hypothetical protein